MQTPDTTPPPAPLPWLDKPAKDDAVQAWSSSIETLTVSYPFVQREFVAVMIHGYKHRWRFIAGLLASLMGLLFAIVMAGSLRPHHSLLSISPWYLVGILLIFPVEFIVIIFLSLWLTTAIVTKNAKKRCYVLTVSAFDMKMCMEPPMKKQITPTLRWADVRGIEDWCGGVYVAAPFGKAAMSVPGSAFASPDDARLFADAVRTLWQTNGDMSAVAPEARARFRVTDAAPPALNEVK